MAGGTRPLLAFANAIDETRPEYIDDASARAAGHRGLLAPPTFCFGALCDTGTMVQVLVETLSRSADQLARVQIEMRSQHGELKIQGEARHWWR